LYTSQPPIHKELDLGSAVLVIFSLGAYELSDGAAKNYNVNLGVSNNVQAVILLADCKEELMRPNKSDEMVPLKNAHFVLAIHHTDTIRMVGFSEEGHAGAVYDSLWAFWAKVLMNTKTSEV